MFHLRHTAKIFQSTLPVWGATGGQSACAAVLKNFNPRSPCGERRDFCKWSVWPLRFQSTLPVWGATLILSLRLFIILKISIHAPRVGSDELRLAVVTQMYYISIHAPRVGSDQNQCPEKNQKSDFNPRSPCGERRSKAVPPSVRKPISIHAPRVGSDTT